MRDHRTLLRAFRQNFGNPNQIFMHRGSLGGIVTAQVIENLRNVGNFVGAYPVCGALGGSRNWDGAVDLRLTYDFL